MAIAPTTHAAAIPSLDRVLREPALAATIDRYGRDEATHALRIELARLREAALAQTLAPKSLAIEGIAASRSASE